MRNRVISSIPFIVERKDRFDFSKFIREQQSAGVGRCRCTQPRFSSVGELIKRNLKGDSI